MCGDDHARAGTASQIIHVQANNAKPSFYFRTQDFVVFVSPEAVLESLDGASHLNPNAAKLGALVRARLPLQEHQDLFRFELQNAIYWAITKAVIIDAISHGNASISNEGGVWSETVRVVQRRSKSMADTTIYDGNKGRSKIIWQLDCIAN